MKKKPKLLLAVALFLYGIALSFPLQIMILYEHAPWEITAILAKFPPLNWAVMLMAPITAYSVYRASPWVLFTVPTLSLIVILNNWFVAELATDYSPFTVGIGTGAFLLSMGTLTTASIRTLFLNPERRWWLTPMRAKTKLPIQLRTEDLAELETITFDISEGGAFVAMPNAEDLPIGARVNVALYLEKLPQTLIRCQAEVVRKTEKPLGHYPAGVGIRFLNLGWRERRALHQLTHQLNGQQTQVLQNAA